MRGRARVVAGGEARLADRARAAVVVEVHVPAAVAVAVLARDDARVARGQLLEADDAGGIVAVGLRLRALRRRRLLHDALLLFEELGRGGRELGLLGLLRLGEHVLGRLVEALGDEVGERLLLGADDRGLKGGVHLLHDGGRRLRAQRVDRLAKLHGHVPVRLALRIVAGRLLERVQRLRHLAVLVRDRRRRDDRRLRRRRAAGDRAVHRGGLLFQLPLVVRRERAEGGRLRALVNPRE